MALRRPDSNPTERGSAIVEFCFVVGVMVPVLLAFTGTGLDALRNLISAQVCRDAGHMFAYNVDFTTAQNRTLLGTLAAPLNMTSTAGDGALVMSSIAWVTDADCTAAKLTACANTNHFAFTSFIQYGTTDPTYMYTAMGTPPAAYITGATKFAVTDYLTNTSLQADGLAAILPSAEQQGQVVYVAELIMKPQLTSTSSNGSYVRAIF